MEEDSSNWPIIETKLGKLLGRTRKTFESFPYFSFQGIPYAKPPLNELRFKAPLPPEPWNGIHDATKEGNRSLTITSDKTIIGDEDCLFINVYTTELPKENVPLKPVMFLIHGGGYYMGSGNMDLNAPDYMIKEDVVMVTFNYRLGILGCVAFEDPTIGVPGNAAFKDMVMALKWVKQNIEYFNGDPNNVTIWGQSAGAIAAHLLMLSPMAKGLFHKAILQSGTGFICFDTAEYLKKTISKIFAKYAGYEVNNDREAYEVLKNLPKEKFIESLLGSLEWGKSQFVGIFGPVIEKNALEPAFIDQDPELYYLEGNITNHVPVIIGSNSMDGTCHATKEHTDGAIQPNFDDVCVVVPTELKIPKHTNECIELGRKIVNFYYGQESPSRRNLDKYVKYQTDMKFNMRIKRFVKLQQAVTSQPIYLYRFAFESPYNIYKKLFGLNVPGVCHGDELTYLLHSKYAQKFRPGSAEERTQYRLVKFWTNFAKTGNPNPEQLNPIINLKWRAVEPNKMNHLHIGKNLVDKDDEPDHMRMLFWNEIYKTYFINKYEQLYGQKPDPDIIMKDIKEQIKLLKWDTIKK